MKKILLVSILLASTSVMAVTPTEVKQWAGAADAVLKIGKPTEADKQREAIDKKMAEDEEKRKKEQGEPKKHISLWD